MTPSLAALPPPREIKTTLQNTASEINGTTSESRNKLKFRRGAKGFTFISYPRTSFRVVEKLWAQFIYAGSLLNYIAVFPPSSPFFLFASFSCTFVRPIIAVSLLL